MKREYCNYTLIFRIASRIETLKKYLHISKNKLQNLAQVQANASLHSYLL